MEGDYEDTRSEGCCWRGCIRFGGGCERLAVFQGAQHRDIPMPLGSFESASGELPLAELVAALGVCWSTMVDVDDERLKVLASGARCVSLSSTHGVRMHNGRLMGYTLFVSFQDMAAAARRSLGARCRPEVGGGDGGPRGAGRQAGRAAGVGEVGRSWRAGRGWWRI